jgi:hypothetical protein
MDVTRQSTTISTSLWWRQRVNDRFELRYEGGVVFSRGTIRSEIHYPDFPVPTPIPRPEATRVATRRFEYQQLRYAVGPAVGLDGRIAMTEPLRLVPGIRLFSLASSWVVRSAVGLEWTF